MIIVKIKGGLGNQLFQYALGRRLTHFNGQQLKLDISYYDTFKLRGYELHNLNIKEDIATADDLKALGITDSKDLGSTLHRALERRRSIEKRHRVVEQSFAFEPKVLNVSKDAYLDGHWQSERYFSEIADIIRAEFTPRQRLDATSEKMVSDIARMSSVSLHIRRGDYVTNPVNREVYATCSNDYYLRCISEMAKRIPDPHFFVFSDEVEWVKENLDFKHPVTYVDHNSQEEAYKDLYLMSKCKHHIIANSTFSWWGAWLANNRDKIVFAPSKWFNTPKPGEQDLIPESWIRI